MAETKKIEFDENESVEVYDVAKKRWYKARTSFCVVFDDEAGEEAWECVLKNGNIGNFDKDHMRWPTS